MAGRHARGLTMLSIRQQWLVHFSEAGHRRVGVLQHLRCDEATGVDRATTESGVSGPCIYCLVTRS